MDGTGIIETEAREIGQDWFSRGCIVPRSGASALLGQTDAINPNAVWEAARRLSHCIRILNRHQFVGYEVKKVAGVQKSVLWFKRASIYNSRIDLFSGIADRICSQAPDGGWTNEWLIGVSLKPYHPSDSSMWKMGSYGDYWALFNRCIFFAEEIVKPNNEDFLWHVSFGQKLAGGNMMAEAPSGYNYARLAGAIGVGDWVNQQDCSGDPTCEANRLKFYKSCRIYEPDAEIESAETVTSGREELVAVTLTGRLRSTYGETGGAPETVDRDVSGWVGATIASEPFRTPENALRLYLLWLATGYNPPATIGDNSLKSGIQSLPDAPFGCIVPHFVFTKLVPLPYDDGNDNQNAADTPLWSDVWSQMDLYLRAMCEGFIDEASTIERSNCAVNETGDDCAWDPLDLFDFKYENLCYAAFGGRSAGILPMTATADIAEADTRPDTLHGCGPLPNTMVSSEVFNRFAAAVDLLVRVRLMVPYHLDVEGHLYSSTPLILSSDDGLCGSEGDGCSATHRRFAWFGVGPRAETLDGPVSLGVYGRTYAALADGCPDGDGNYALGTYRFTCAYEFAVDDTDVLYAMPETWRDMFSASAGTLWCRYYDSYRWVAGDGSTDVEPGGSAEFDCSFTRQVLAHEVGCVFAASGAIDFGPTAPKSWFGDYFDSGTYPISWGIGSESVMYMTPLTGQSLYLEIPLVDV